MCLANDRRSISDKLIATTTHHLIKNSKINVVQEVSGSASDRTRLATIDFQFSIKEATTRKNPKCQSFHKPEKKHLEEKLIGRTSLHSLLLKGAILSPQIRKLEETSLEKKLSELKLGTITKGLSCGTFNDDVTTDESDIKSNLSDNDTPRTPKPELSNTIRYNYSPPPPPSRSARFMDIPVIPDFLYMPAL